MPCRFRFRSFVISLTLCLGGCFVQGIDSRNAAAHAQAGYAAEGRGEWDTARRQFAQAVMNADLAGANPLIKAPLNYEYGKSLGVECSWEMAGNYLLRAKQFSEESGQTPYLAVMELALLNDYRGNTDVAARYYAELLPLIDKEHLQEKYPLGVADIFDRFAVALKATGHALEAEGRFADAQKIRRDHPEAKPFGSVTPYGTACR